MVKSKNRGLTLCFTRVAWCKCCLTRGRLVIGKRYQEDNADVNM